MTIAIVLPEFAKPPVTEVAISVQFQSLSAFGIIHAGGLWQVFRDRFPIVEYHPPLPSSFETFGLEGVQANQFRFDLSRDLPLPRIWFRNTENSKLIQFQLDKFTLNWQKTSNDFGYPRYKALREEFVSIFEEISNYIKSENIGDLLANQCELTYVNIIKSTKLPLRCFQKTELPSVGELEDAILNVRYKIADETGTPVGRLIAASAQGMDGNGNTISQLTLTGRGPPKLPTFGAVLDFIDTAHTAIVMAFADLTPVELHQEWERRV